MRQNAALCGNGLTGSLHLGLCGKELSNVSVNCLIHLEDSANIWFCFHQYLAPSWQLSSVAH